MQCFEQMEMLDFNAGDVIFRRGEIGRHLYFVENGGVSAILDDRIIRSFTEGDFFGEMAFIANLKALLADSDDVPTQEIVRVCDMHATQNETRCWQLSVDTFAQVMRRSPADNNATIGLSLARARARSLSLSLTLVFLSLCLLLSLALPTLSLFSIYSRISVCDMHTD